MHKIPEIVRIQSCSFPIVTHRPITICMSLTVPIPMIPRSISHSSSRQSACMAPQTPRHELLASRYVLNWGGESVWLEGVHSTNHLVGDLVKSASYASHGGSGRPPMLTRPGVRLDEAMNFQELSKVRAKCTLAIFMLARRLRPRYCLICANIICAMLLFLFRTRPRWR